MNKKIFAVISVAALIFLLIAVIVLESKKSSELKTNTSPQTQTLPKPALSQPAQIKITPTLKPKKQTAVIGPDIINKLPYQTPNFTVEYFNYDNVLMITITSRTFKKGYEQAVMWLEQQEIRNPDNYKNIIFNFPLVAPNQINNQ